MAVFGYYTLCRTKWTLFKDHRKRIECALQQTTTTTIKYAKYRVLSFRLMACVTLKRSLELEPLYSPTGNSAKRRRCAPLTPLFARNDQSHGERQMARKIQHSSIGATKHVEARRVFGDNGSQSPQSGASGAFSPLPMPSNGSLLRFHLRSIEIRISGSILFPPQLSEHESFMTRRRTCYFLT